MPKFILDKGKIIPITDESIILDKLPPQIYYLHYDKEEYRFVLTEADIDTTIGTVFGNVYEKVDSVFNYYENHDKHIGFILSGRRGMGKTLTARIAMNRAVAMGIPAIIVEDNGPGLVKYLSSLKLDLFILFDEFEKKFPPYRAPRLNRNSSDNVMIPDVQSDDITYQVDMLGMFSGTSVSYGRIWCITCNKAEGLNSLLINRTSRFRYHFKHELLSAATVRAFLQSRLPKACYSQIDSIVQFSESVRCLNYDTLNAIAVEIADGRTLDDVFDMLNILPTGTVKYTVEVEFDNDRYSDPTNYYIRDVMQAVNDTSKTPVYERISIFRQGHIVCQLSFTLANAKWEAGLCRYVVGEEFLPKAEVHDPVTQEKLKIKAIYIQPDTSNGPGIKHMYPDVRTMGGDSSTGIIPTADQSTDQYMRGRGDAVGTPFRRTPRIVDLM